jgi:basic membrane protein A
VAKEFPNLKFAAIDAEVKQPNVQSTSFKEHEGSTSWGFSPAWPRRPAPWASSAAWTSPHPPLRLRLRARRQGRAEAAQVVQNMTGTTGAAWNDPVKGGELAKSQIDRGADVIYHAAGGTGIGVLRAAADAGKLGIGVDSNQNMLHPARCSPPW